MSKKTDDVLRQLHACLELDCEPIAFHAKKPLHQNEKFMGVAEVVNTKTKPTQKSSSHLKRILRKESK